MAAYSHRCLLLNASMEPLSVVTLRRAVLLVLSDKAVIVETNGCCLRSQHCVIPMPLVLSLTRYVHIPYARIKHPSRRMVLLRDSFTCAYCSRPATTVDHIVPRSRGGMHEWANVVAACGQCNSKKADRLLAEIGWTLSCTPREPHRALALVASSKVEPTWEPYLKMAA
jgi:5-methylcytosine-specific restriction endonuclease McrA